MRVGLVRTPRRPRWPASVVAACCLWVMLVIVAAHVGRVTGRRTALCPFKLITGLPCPTCGSGRAAVSLIHGRPLAAVQYNPLVVAAGVVCVGAVALRVVAARRIDVSVGRRARALCWAAAAALLLANWIYLVLQGR